MNRVPKRPIPHSFVLEQLETLSPYTKPMFGCTSVYVDDKIVFILRERKDFPRDNGVWVATIPEHHQSLRHELPSLRDIGLFGPGPTGWQCLPSSELTFEEDVIRACEMALQHDPRIGKIPKKRIPSPGKKMAKREKAFRKKK